ncbi:hypothetical protein [Rhizobium terrae]|uniref:hypothetical protein n=1 Tax=Rhizobium terrae TaxID=2171756 RepID=UPI000E3CD800|nr:hypothetical protein [Rhizobium terrae]
MRLCFRFVLRLLLLLAPFAAAAGEPVRTDLKARVPGAATVTYLDLARQIVPDLARAEGAAWRGDTLDEAVARKLDLDTDWPDGFVIEHVEVIDLASAGPSRFIVLFDFGISNGDPAAPALLALYSAAGSIDTAPRLRDVLNVGFDRDTGFPRDAMQPLDPQSQLIVVSNGHWNSQQAYGDLTLVLAGPGGLRTIDDVMTFSETFCGLRRTQEPRISVRKEGSVPMAAIRVDVLLRDEPVRERCSERTAARRDRTITVTYRWNKVSGRYEPDSKALEKLASENEKRF